MCLGHNDVIKKAYISTYTYDGCSDKEINKRLDNNTISSDREEIIMDAEEVILEMSNGNIVSINNSEWGSIMKLEQKPKEV